MEHTEYNEEGEAIRYGIVIAHYHGDFVRLLFVAAAGLMLLMQFTGTAMPLSPGALILFVAVLAVTAGITSPVQRVIHWFNLLISFVGLVLFGVFSMERLHSLRSLFSHDGLAGLIALIFLATLYLGTRTVRAIMTGTNTALRARKP